MGALAPTVSVAVQRSTGSGPMGWQAICTSMGLKAIGDYAPDPSRPADATMVHCPYCSMQPLALVPPEAPWAADLAPQGHAPMLAPAPAGPPGGHGRTPACPRGPPAAH